MDSAHTGIILDDLTFRRAPQGGGFHRREGEIRQQGLYILHIRLQVLGKKRAHRLGQRVRIRMLGLGRGHFHRVGAATLLPQGAGIRQGAQRAFTGEEVVLVGQEEHGIGSNTCHQIHIVKALGDAARPEHLVVRVDAGFHHGAVIGGVGAGSRRRKAVTSRHHEHAGLGAAAGMAGQADAACIHILAGGQVIQGADAILDEIPRQALANQLGLPVQQVVLARTPLDGLVVHVQLKVLKALALAQRIQQQHDHAGLHQQLRQVLIFRICLAAVVMANGHQHGRGGFLHIIRDIHIGGSPGALAGLEEQLFQGVAPLVLPGDHFRLARRDLGQPADALQEQTAHLLLIRKQGCGVLHCTAALFTDEGTFLSAAQHICIHIGSTFNRKTVQTILNFPQSTGVRGHFCPLVQHGLHPGLHLLL